MKDLLGDEKFCLFGERDWRGLLALRGEWWRTSGEEGRVSGSADVDADESSMISVCVVLVSSIRAPGIRRVRCRLEVC